MSRIKIGQIDDKAEAFVVTQGFDFEYEVVEDDTVDTFESIDMFANEVMMVKYGIGYFRLKMIAEELLQGLIADDKAEAIKYCKEHIGMGENEIEMLGGK